ncbi:MAG: hypothetical protein ACR2NA_08395 [Solirubrobacterales bacterium]
MSDVLIFLAGLVIFGLVMAVTLPLIRWEGRQREQDDARLRDSQVPERETARHRS